MNAERLTAVWWATRARFAIIVVTVPFVAILLASALAHRVWAQHDEHPPRSDAFDAVIHDNEESLMRRGRDIFRFDTFGDEHFWGDTLQLHRAVVGARFGGVGPGVSPTTALAVGLKVDVDAVPEPVLDALRSGHLDLNDPANTIALLGADAIVGVKTFANAGGQITSIGIECAFCHSTVDNSFAQGIGHRLDGWPNRDLNVGAIVSLAPDLSAVADLLQTDQATVRRVVQSWGPGKFDAELLMDGKAFRPDGSSGATLIPPAFGLAGMNLHTYTGWGSVPYWNAFVANLEMHGQGTFFDPRLADSTQFPVAARAGFNDVRSAQDRVTAKLGALQFYQLAIPAPAPPTGSFDVAAAARGQEIFGGAGRCATCHVPPLFSEPGRAMHTAPELGIDSFQADRAPDHRYRTTPLKGLWAHAKGGFYHDGRFPTLLAVVQHYNTTFGLGLSDRNLADLVEYLKSL